MLIVDLRLVGGSGLELIRHIRTRSPASPAPSVLVLTAALPPQVATELEQLDSQRVRTMAKPFDIDELLAVVRKLAGGHDPPSRQSAGSHIATYHWGAGVDRVPPRLDGHAT